MILESTQQSLKDCMDACSKYLPCHNVDFHTKSKKCDFGKHHGPPTIAALGFQSAYSLGCAGASDPEGCSGNNVTPSTTTGGLDSGVITDDASNNASPGSNGFPDSGPSQPPSLAPGQCPPDDGERRTVDGITYTAMCKEAYSTGNPKYLSNATEAECVKACSADSTCQGANFNTNTSLCELRPDWVGQPKFTEDRTYWIAYRLINER